MTFAQKSKMLNEGNKSVLGTHTHTTGCTQRACKNLLPQCYWHEMVHLCQTSFYQNPVDLGMGSNPAYSWINQQFRPHLCACGEMGCITWEGRPYLFLVNPWRWLETNMSCRAISLQPSVSLSAVNHGSGSRLERGIQESTTVCLCGVVCWL